MPGASSLLCRAAARSAALLPLLRKGSSVVLTTSVAADLGTATSSAYGASKAALSSPARKLSNELAPRGVRVNEVSPGPIEAPIYDKLGMPAAETGASKIRWRA